MIQISLNLAIRDPRAALELEQEAIALARRIGQRDMELLLIGNASEDAIRTGDWDFPAAEFASLDGLDIDETIRLPMENSIFVIGLLRGTADGAAIVARFDDNLKLFGDPDVMSTAHDTRGWAAFAEGRFGDASRAWLEMADISTLNAPYVLPRAAEAALLADDAAPALEALDRLVATGAHGRALETARTSIRAGLAALEGRPAEAVASYRTALASWRELGLLWDECLTSMTFVHLVGANDPDARAAGLAAQAILRRLGATSVLASLDPWLSDGSGDWPGPGTVAASQASHATTADEREAEPA